MLSTKFGTQVVVNSIDLGIFNRFVVDNLVIYDKNNTQLISASRASAKLNFLDLANGKITINAAQLFGLKANIYRETADSATNIQFIIDSLSSKKKETETPINLQISSLIIRHGQIAYNVHDIPETATATPDHINLSDISAHLILNTLTNDSVNLNIKKLAFKEKNGLTLKRFAMKCMIGRSNGKIEDFTLELPNSHISIPEVTASYTFRNKKFDTRSLDLNGYLDIKRITPSDLGGLVYMLNSYSNPISLYAQLSNHNNEFTFTNLLVKDENNFEIKGEGSVINWMNKDIGWDIKLNDIRTSSNGIANIAENLGYGNKLPHAIHKLGKIITSVSSKGNTKVATAEGTINTDCGSIDFSVSKNSSKYKANIELEELNLGSLLNYQDIGNITSSLQADASFAGNSISVAEMKAAVSSFSFRGHKYNDINVAAELSDDKMLHASLDVNDDSGDITIEADYDTSSKVYSGLFHVKASHLNPEHLRLSNQWPDTSFDFEIEADLHGNDINDADANMSINRFSMQSPVGRYAFNNLTLKKTRDNNGVQRAVLKSDFATIMAEGHLDFTTLKTSITNAIRHRLPTLPGLPEEIKTHNQLSLYGTITSTEFAEKLLKLPLRIYDPVHIIAKIDDSKHLFDLNLDASSFSYDNKEFRDGYAIISSPNDTIKARVNINSIGKTGSSSSFLIKANAIANHLNTSIDFKAQGDHTINGSLNADTRFHTNDKGLSEANINILPSSVLIADTAWTINPASVTYYKNYLQVEHFSVHHDNQYITINGLATDNAFDDIELDLKDVNVSYILDLVNFHSVEFAGYASGRAKARSLFGNPHADAHLNVKNFSFESGEMGTLVADADWNMEQGNININGIIMDGEHHNIVRGYVSPKNSNIDLNVHADGIRLKFIEKYTDSFLNNIEARAWGNVQIVGPFSTIQLIGDARADGKLSVVPLNTEYTLRNGRIILKPDNIHFENDSIYDINGHIGVVNGNLNHRHLGHFTYDIDVVANNILALDLKDTGDDEFYGTVYATGICNIRDDNGNVIIDVNATPDRGSTIVYNAASPDAITNREFIHWNDRNATHDDVAQDEYHKPLPHNISSNLYLNLLIHCNPNATLKVLMDRNTGDHIALQGNGVIRASYYNKGAFNLFGNYVVSSGTYTLTVQNLLKRTFEFQPGGTIAFGGDAYNAALNLQALYTVNGVSLSDISIGKSFTNNNVRVDCLMNISGTPGQPHVDFSLDMPTVSTDAKQMIMSLMNNEEEINQQVLYLLAVGRFLNQSNNSSYNDVSRQSQTSLAMQSILSGTLSQQLSSVLSNVVPNNNWNFGANISTGDEGFNNAEYEGLLSGRLLNNRLLINGQFGYRDNENATSSFIGDFDIRYLLVPNGNAAVKVYNQTNDKYFTKNSLNTQGVGIIFKKDFNNVGDLIPWKKRKQNTNAK